MNQTVYQLGLLFWRQSIHRLARHRLAIYSRRLLLAVLTGLLWGGVLSPEAQAIPLARMRRLEPVVQVRSARARNWVVARERGALTYGDTMRTGAKGKADVLFANGTKIAMRGGTSIQIVPPANPNDPLVIRLFGALSEVFVRPKGNTQIRTAAAIAAARGTEYLVRLVDENTTQVIVTEGSVDFANEQGRVVVEANQQSVARVGQAPTVPVAVDVSGALRWTADVTQLPLEWETPFRSINASNAARELQRAQRAAAGAPQNIEAQQRLAEAFYDAFEYSNAAEQFQKIAQMQPQNVAALVGLSRAQRARGDGDAALEAANRALQTEPDNQAARLELALSQLVRGDNAAAQAALSNIQATPQAQAVLGLVALRGGDANRAEASFRAALASSPNLSSARSLLALSLLTQNRVAQAEIEARMAVAVQPLSAQNQGALSLVLFFRGDLRGAQAASRLAVQANPDSPFALLTQGRVLVSQGRLDAARDALARAQALAPQLPIVASELGEVYLRLGQLPKAESNFRLALAQSPNLAAARSGLGATLEAQGQKEGALAELQRAIELDPQNTSARTRLVEFYIARGELQKAEALVPKNLAPTPESGLLLARLSELSLFRQDLLLALDYARRAVGLLPGSSLAHYQLGRVYLEQNRTFQAEQQFRQAAILDRENAAARFALGTVREQIESGRDLTRASSLLSEANLGGAFRGLNLQNLQSPGTEDRIQAALQDPTVARIATRSYGDTQIDGVLGDKGRTDAVFSSLHESGDRRGLLGVTALTNSRNGARFNSDQTTDRIGLMLGQKAKNNSSGLFFLGQFEHVDQGLNTDNLSSFARDARLHINKPSVLFGGNLQKSQDRRTRFLLHWTGFNDESRGFERRSFNEENGQSYSFELRHDRQIGAKNYLSAGFGLGRARRDTDLFFGAFPPFVPDLAFTINTRVRSAEAYIRNDFSPNNRLTLTGELQVKKLENDSSTQITRPVVLPPSNSKFVDRVFVLPKFVLDYRLNADTGIRLRMRRVLGSITDFELLHPTDLFTALPNNLPLLGIGGRGNSVELEADHTFGNSSFLRINLFGQHLNDVQEPSADVSAGQLVKRARLRGLNASYEGSIGRETTFYLSTTFNDAQDETRNRAIAFVPRFVGEAGLQYLRRDGWFVQPSYVYQGARFVPHASGTGREKRAGFGMLNLRVGKRFGLSSAFYAEVANISDQKFDILGVQQPGRQFRIGASQRF